VAIVKTSSRYQVTIPRSIRDTFEIYPGEKFHVFHYENRLELIPEKSLKSMRGFIKGIDTTIERDRDKI
jgi:AbrB family looped-hinge helix DNA binding protein